MYEADKELHPNRNEATESGQGPQVQAATAVTVQAQPCPHYSLIHTASRRPVPSTGLLLTKPSGSLWGLCS